MCKDVVIEMELIQSHVENALQQDLKLESGLQHALDVLINGCKHSKVDQESAPVYECHDFLGQTAISSSKMLFEIYYFS